VNAYESLGVLDAVEFEVFKDSWRLADGHGLEWRLVGTLLREFGEIVENFS